MLSQSTTAIRTAMACLGSLSALATIESIKKNAGTAITDDQS
jgi:hypothetical protein